MNEAELLENTEMLEESTEETYAEVVVGDSAMIETLTMIRDDLHIIMVFTIITFVMSCFRGWRKNVVRGVR